MAIDWRVAITLKNNGHYAGMFERFEDSKPDVVLDTIVIHDAVLDTDEQKAALWDTVWEAREEQSATHPHLAELEGEGRTELLKKEILLLET